MRRGHGLDRKDWWDERIICGRRVGKWIPAIYAKACCGREPHQIHIGAKIFRRNSEVLKRQQRGTRRVREGMTMVIMNL